jgi:hypothetical protein
MLWRYKDLDASRNAGLSADETGPLKGEDHLVDRGRGDAEVVLHFALGGRSPMHAGIGVDEGQILALLGGEAWDRGVHVT